ncbi:MAG: poly(ADP-ribose) glycohydrolase domain-containing protein, partial [Syntrophobacteraceae bacterium]
MNGSKIKISRELAAEYGRQAVQITESGEYLAPSGRVVNLSRLVKRSIDGRVSYPPDQPLQESSSGSYQTKITVENMTTLEAAFRLTAQGCRP